MPTASLVCEGFRGQAATTATGLGLPGLPTALVPGHVDVQSVEELAAQRGRGHGGRGHPEPHRGAAARGRRGGRARARRHRLRGRSRRGQPLLLRERLERRPADRAADSATACGRSCASRTGRAETELGVAAARQRRRATVWNVAVNGVMAGCRPEYMPMLVALVEAMADPRYGVEHSGNTPGAETLIILNGPLIKELGFNYEQGALRDGIQANTTIGRFWRLYLRNVAGFLHHRTDKGTFGNTWRVVLAENEDVLRRIGWTTIAEDEGVAAEQRGDDLALHRRRRHRVGVRQRPGADAAVPRRLHRAEGRLGAHVHGRHGGGEPAAAAPPEPDPRARRSPRAGSTRRRSSSASSSWPASRPASSSATSASGPISCRGGRRSTGLVKAGQIPRSSRSPRIRSASCRSSVAPRT